MTATPPIRIESGGTVATTRVYVGDMQLLNVVGIRWELDCDDQSGVARVWLEVVDAHLDVTADQADTEITVRSLE